MATGRPSLVDLEACRPLRLSCPRRQAGTPPRTTTRAFVSFFSAATVSKGEYGVPAGLVFSYPCRSDGKGNLTVVEGLKLDAFGKQKFQATLQELLEEREAVRDMLPT